MSNFINSKDTMEIPTNKEEAGVETETYTTNEVINTCVIAITSEHPYDTSSFVNNSTTFYTKITYSELIKLYDLIDLVTNESEINEDVKSSKSSESSKSSDMNLLYVVNCFKDSSIKMIFRFLCSPDCNDGASFIDHEITSKVYDFVKLVTRRNCIIEVSDHSMGSFFKNWNNDCMGIANPIEILPITHSGSFKMYGDKNHLINSVHPTLKQIGNLSSSEVVEITFNNLGGTKVYKILDDKVNLISKGVQLYEKSRNRYECGLGFELLQRSETIDVYNEVPVHCEFDFQKGKIVISSTHWCNLDSVETPVDLPTLRRYCTDSLGFEATQNLETTLSLAVDEGEYKRIISNTVRQISSGIDSRPLKKNKINSTSISTEL